MNDVMKNKIVSVFNERILSPVLYMVEYENMIDLICFLDGNVTEDDIYDTEYELCAMSYKPFEIIDIREFNETDRLEIIHDAELIYSSDKLVKIIFEQSMFEDYEIMLREREEAHIRYEDNHSPYVQ